LDGLCGWVAHPVDHLHQPPHAKGFFYGDIATKVKIDQDASPVANAHLYKLREPQAHLDQPIKLVLC
jgi:hypothetical protein